MASETTVRVVIDAVNNTGGQFKQVSNQMKTLGVNLESINKTANKVALGIAGFATAGFLAGKKAVEAAQESIKADKQLEAVLKSTGGVAGVTAEQVNKLSSEFQRQTNFEDDAIKSAQNLLLTFTKIGKDIFPTATETVLDMSAALGQDLKSSSIQLGKALQDPAEGVNALRRVGVNFSDEQRRVIETLVETGKTAEAQKLILQELATEFGGSAKAQRDPIEQMKNAISNAWEAIGVQLLPIIDKLATKIQDFAENTLPEWIDQTKQIIDWLKQHQGVVDLIVVAVTSLATAFVALKVTLLAQGVIGAI